MLFFVKRYLSKYNRSEVETLRVDLVLCEADAHCLHSSLRLLSWILDHFPGFFTVCRWGVYETALRVSTVC